MKLPNLKVLKSLGQVTDVLKPYQDLDFKDVEIQLNHILPEFESIGQALNLLNIPNVKFKPSSDFSEEAPVEFNFAVGHELNSEYIYLFSHILYCVTGKEPDIYISYNQSTRVTIGTYLTRDSDELSFNVSTAISYLEILRCELSQLSKDDLQNRFPLVNESPDYNTFDHDDYDDYDNYDDYDRESNGQYAGSYAQDEMGLSDDFIDDVLGGEPSNYWNID